jgi:NAD(P)-dependent dehydrogenase (short-subunit alcohol dehydrogenase family)
MLDVNAKGVFLCYAAAARQMIKQGRGTVLGLQCYHIYSTLMHCITGGVIIGACSIAGYRGSDVSALYSMSK